MVEKLLISEAFERYRSEFIVFRNQSKKTEEMHRLAQNLLVSFLGDINIHDLTFQMVRDWKEHLESCRGQNTVRGYIIKLRVVLSFLRMHGYKVLDPDLIGVPKRQVVVVDFLTEDEVTHLINASFQAREGYGTMNRYRNRAIIAILYASGIRVSELTRLNRFSIQPDGTFTIIGKGNKPRLCFMDDRSRQYLTEYLERRSDTEHALFISPRGGHRISVATVQEILRRASTYAGFNRPIHPHTLRHSFATNMLRNNANLVYVRDFLGHSSVQTTEMYTHVVNEDLHRIYKESHSI